MPLNCKKNWNPKASRVIPSLDGRVLALVAFLLFLPSLVRGAQVLEVCKGCALSSIHQALSQAQSGDTIEVLAGHYKEGPLLIEKMLTLRGKGRPSLDGQFKGNTIWVRANGVKIEGFAILNSGQSSIQEFAGIRVEEAADCEIKDNVLRDNTYSIYLAKVQRCRIEGNVAQGNTQGEVSGGNGLHAWYSSHLEIINNQFKNHRDGIYLEFTTDTRVEANLSTKNIRYGLHFMYAHRNSYLDNRFIENQTGVAVMYSRHIKMLRNSFEKSWGRSSYGLLLKDIADSHVEANRFEGNTIGLFADEVSRDQFVDNIFRNNGWAIQILGNASENSFTGNLFLNNFFNVATNSRQNENRFDGNFWSDYRGYDLNKDGIGDLPFRPMKIFGLWVSKYPELVVLLGSPVISFLEVAEKVFPILTPKTLQDNRPLLKLDLQGGKG